MTVLPRLDDLNRAYWTGGADGVLRVARCRDCRRWVHPPVPYCAACGGRDVVPEPTGGHGTILTFTVNHQRWRPDDEVPYVVAIVALEEQDDLRIMARVDGADPDRVAIGDRVAVAFVPHDEVWVPVVRPVEGTGR